MAIDYKKWGVLGAAVGAGTGYLVNWMNVAFGYVASVIPGINVQVQAVSPGIDLKITGIKALVSPGASPLVQKVLGYSPIPLTLPEVAILAIAGAAMFMIAAWILDAGNINFSSKGKKLGAVLALSAIGTGLILTQAIPAIAATIVVVIIALIWGYALAFVDKSLGLNLIP